eukprot:4880078-Prymnesium_polylepis.1
MERSTEWIDRACTGHGGGVSHSVQMCSRGRSPNSHTAPGKSSARGQAHSRMCNTARLDVSGVPRASGEACWLQSASDKPTRSNIAAV